MLSKKARSRMYRNKCTSWQAYLEYLAAFSAGDRLGQLTSQEKSFVRAALWVLLPPGMCVDRPVNRRRMRLRVAYSSTFVSLAAVMDADSPVRRTEMLFCCEKCCVGGRGYSRDMGRGHLAAASAAARAAASPLWAAACASGLGMRLVV